MSRLRRSLVAVSDAQTCLTAFYKTRKCIIYNDPEYQIGHKHHRRPHVTPEPYVEHYQGCRSGEDGYHGETMGYAQRKKFVMDMGLVGEERTLAAQDPVHENPEDIHARYGQRSKGYYHYIGGDYATFYYICGLYSEE